ncbi:hypothetical protein BJY14_007797 [Actinomadura luteofluorescens]|uniref:Uncharacterized protein n=1 Tax=Actinomadura luteofluorescens TaxID=46163 RepID=A0A7Y9EQA1_9ACTN|nr:hypothetical protein [Actinomadura luteofluorescens]
MHYGLRSPATHANASATCVPTASTAAGPRTRSAVSTVARDRVREHDNPRTDVQDIHPLRRGLPLMATPQTLGARVGLGEVGPTSGSPVTGTGGQPGPAVGGLGAAGGHCGEGVGAVGGGLAGCDCGHHVVGACRPIGLLQFGDVGGERRGVDAGGLSQCGGSGRRPGRPARAAAVRHVAAARLRRRTAARSATGRVSPSTSSTAGTAGGGQCTERAARRPSRGDLPVERSACLRSGARCSSTWSGRRAEWLPGAGAFTAG